MAQNLMTDTAIKIKSLAKELGFSIIGITGSKPFEDQNNAYVSWLKNNYHADMHYMKRNITKRFSPKELFPETQSVISLGFNYYHPPVESSSGIRISMYAYGEDYHKVLKDKAKNIVALIKTLHPESSSRIFVDSAPVLERAAAVRAGLGWIGKNCTLINPEYGSFLFLTEIFTSLQLPVDETVTTPYCGDCNRCIEACPTGALNAPFLLDANRCITYQNSVNRSEIPGSMHGKMAGYIYGCDICQLVCPYNSRLKRHSEPRFLPSDQLLHIQWNDLTKEEFNSLFKKSVIKSVGYNKLMNNIRFVEYKDHSFPQENEEN